MAIQEKIISRLLSTEAGKKKVEEIKSSAVNTAKKAWAEETSQVLKEINTEKIEKRKYVVTTGYGTGSLPNKSFEAKELPSGKVYSTLYRLYSDAPGSVQCVDRIKDSVIGAGYVITPIKGQKGTKQDLKKLLEFFDNPNEEGETIEDIVGGGIVNLLSYGNWYIEKVMNKTGTELKEIYNLDSSMMTILVDDDLHKGGVDAKKGYERLTNFSKKIIYLPNEIVHIKRSAPNGSIYGQAVLETNTATLMLVLNALTYNINIMKNGGVSTVQINLPEDSNENDAEAVSRFYETNYSGPWNAGKPFVTFKGAKINSLGITPQEMRYMELLEYSVRQIAGQYGVPLILIGIPDGTNRATASATIKSFYLNKIYPLRKYIASKITQDIIIDGLKINGWQLSFRSSGLEESDSNRRDVMTGYTKGLYNFNEAREKMGLLPIEDEWAAEYYLVGSKNDVLVPVKRAISNGDKPTPKVKAPGDKTPANPEAPKEDKPNRTQGEGADEGDK